MIRYLFRLLKTDKMIFLLLLPDEKDHTISRSTNQLGARQADTQSIPNFFECTDRRYSGIGRCYFKINRSLFTHCHYKRLSYPVPIYFIHDLSCSRYIPDRIVRAKTPERKAGWRGSQHPQCHCKKIKFPAA